MASIDIKDAGTIVVKIRTELRAAAVRGIYSAALRGVQDVVARIIPSRTPEPFDRGLYKAGWRATPLPNEGATIDNPEPHAVFIEYGVRAENVKIGRKMILALAAWAKRKGLVSKGRSAESIAWGIAKNMKKRGIYNRGGNTGGGLGILKELRENYLNRYIQEEVSREIAREFNGAKWVRW